MPKAIPIPITSRRNMLAGASAALLAGAAIACQAKSATAGADAEMIALCNRVVAIRRETDALYEIRHDKESEDRTQPAMDALYDERDAVLDRINELPAPSSLAGARAVAAAARSLLLRDVNGEDEYSNDSEWLAFHALEFLTGSAVA